MLPRKHEHKLISLVHDGWRNRKININREINMNIKSRINFMRITELVQLKHYNLIIFNTFERIV